jgi:hypothetical protein
LQIHYAVAEEGMSRWLPSPERSPDGDFIAISVHNKYLNITLRGPERPLVL